MKKTLIRVFALLLVLCGAAGLVFYFQQKKRKDSYVVLYDDPREDEADIQNLIEVDWAQSN